MEMPSPGAAERDKTKRQPHEAVFRFTKLPSVIKRSELLPDPLHTENILDGFHITAFPDLPDRLRTDVPASPRGCGLDLYYEKE